MSISSASSYGLLVRFHEPEELLSAVELARESGYTRIDAFTPFAVEELAVLLGQPRTGIAPLALVSGIAGGVAGFALMTYTSVWAYPVNVGGRPLFSWPSFVPITFELTVLGAALAVFLGMIVLSRLPRLHHPLFNVPDFAAATTDGFFLLIHADDARFDAVETPRQFAALPGCQVYEVPR